MLFFVHKTVFTISAFCLYMLPLLMTFYYLEKSSEGEGEILLDKSMKFFILWISIILVKILWELF